MARKDLPPQLRTVDDEPKVEVPVVVLSDQGAIKVSEDDRPLRLGSTPVPIIEEPEGDFSHRLNVPSKEELELRTHQPGIEVLIEPEAAASETPEEDWGQATQRKPVPWGWFVLIAIAIVSALVWSATRVKDADASASQIRRDTVASITDDQMEDRAALARIEAIESVIKAFFNASTIESMAKQIRQPERVVPLMQVHYANRKIGGLQLKSIALLQPLPLERRADFWIASVSLVGEGKTNLIIQTPEDGSPKVDWETFVCYQPMPWDKFVLERPLGTSMEFRVYAMHDSFFTHEFYDSSKWSCFRLTALNNDEPLYGYVQRGSEIDLQITEILRLNRGAPASLMLKLIVPEGLVARRSAIIEEVSNVRWLHIDPPETGE